MPCAIGRGKPNSRAPSREVWIGLRSPETRGVVGAHPGRHPPASPTAAGGAARSRAGRVARPSAPDRCRYVDTPRHTSSPSTVAAATTSNCRPRSCGRRSSACTARSSALAGVERPAHRDPVGDVHQPDQREREVRRRSSAASPAGTPARAGRSPAARRSAGTRTPGRTRPGVPVDGHAAAASSTSGSADRRPVPAAAERGPRYAPAVADGSTLRRHHAPSRLWPQTRTTLPVTPAEPGDGEPGDRLGHVDRQAALRHAVHPPAGLAEQQRHPRGHRGLDEARRDRVDRDARARRSTGASDCDQPDHAGLGGGVVGLPAVAGDAGDRGDRRRSGRRRASARAPAARR